MDLKVQIKMGGCIPYIQFFRKKFFPKSVFSLIDKFICNTLKNCSPFCQVKTVRCPKYGLQQGYIALIPDSLKNDLYNPLQQIYKAFIHKYSVG